MDWMLHINVLYDGEFERLLNQYLFFEFSKNLPDLKYK